MPMVQANTDATVAGRRQVVPPGIRFNAFTVSNMPVGVVLDVHIGPNPPVRLDAFPVTLGPFDPSIDQDSVQGIDVTVVTALPGTVYAFASAVSRADAATGVGGTR